ncbi:MAG: hypothetical protein V3U65_03390 [Granulosicoccaceae bacterium]
MLKQLSIITGALLSSVWVASYAQSQHAEHTPGMSHGAMTAGVLPTEGGQSSFAAIIEIVALLEADPETKWADVEIDALHSHLLDMNNLILSTTARTEVLDTKTVQFNVEGAGASLEAIHRMAPAHTRFLQQSRGWDIRTDLTKNGATVQIAVNKDLSRERLTALGFYGFMSLDSHHQAHHLRIATGKGH